MLIIKKIITIVKYIFFYIFTLEKHKNIKYKSIIILLLTKKIKNKIYFYKH